MESLFERMVRAVVDEKLDRISELLNAGYSINTSNEWGETAFSYACANNCLTAAKLLFSRGAEINTIDAGGGSPLDWAVCHSSPEFQSWLIGIGGRRNDTSYEPWKKWRDEDKDGNSNYFI